MSTLKVNALTNVSGNADITGVGKVLQMKQTVKTGDFSTSISQGNYNIITGLNVNITPSSTSNKILIHAVIVGSNSGDNVHTGFEIRNGSTRLTGYEYTGALNSRTPTMSSTRNDSTNVLFTVPIFAQDSPSSTSQQTYNVYVSNEGYIFTLNKGQYGHARVQNYCGISTITAFEVAA
tara:strand:+ start:3317 stop:3850 length:534 start_codon:yes stop_codon:yes gene_type:complete